jgi:hypothetical protein
MCKGITHMRRLEQQSKEHRWENFQISSRVDRIRARKTSKVNSSRDWKPEPENQRQKDSNRTSQAKKWKNMTIEQQRQAWSGMFSTVFNPSKQSARQQNRTSRQTPQRARTRKVFSSTTNTMAPGQMILGSLSTASSREVLTPTSKSFATGKNTLVSDVCFEAMFGRGKMTLTRKPIESPFERIASFARGLLLFLSSMAQ